MIFTNRLIFVSLTTIMFSLSINTQTNLLFHNKKQNFSRDTLWKHIDQILDDSSFGSCFIGAKIITLADNRTLYERNSKKLFHPASNQKLLTTAAVLNLLNANYEITTKCFISGEIFDGMINGNLYIKGSGDPLLTTWDLDSLASRIKMKGITSITGDLVGDDSYFDSLYWGQGWMWDDEPSSNEAFISSLCVNKNSVKINIQPTSNTDDALSIILEPTLSSISIVNYGVCTSDTSIPELTVSRLRGENKIIVQGRINPGSESKDYFVSVWKPEMIFLQLLRDRMKLQGISVMGKSRLGMAGNRKHFTEIKHTLDSVIHRANKFSDNLAAENLLKILAAEKVGIPGTAQNGLQLVKNLLLAEGIDTTNMILADGSGASWYNEIAPEAIVKLLYKMYKKKTIFQRYYESLAIAGVDGTLKTRLKNTRASNNIRAKTGSLRGVSGISGYGTTLNNKMFAFSILCNHFHGDIVVLRNAQDKILELLVNSTIGEK
jgi:D-alanyl-D-alanine carboxypeptidase/D-alanyl-D-alanine-endopeptidase (penicillin-binding protein 4)